MQQIGVERTLPEVKSELEDRGYEVLTLEDEEDARECDCCVITGLDKGMMGWENVFTEGSVINAQGSDIEEICQRVEQRLE